MKTALITFLLLIVFTIIVSFSMSERPPIKHVAPTIRSDLHPGQTYSFPSHCKRAVDYCYIYRCPNERNSYFCSPNMNVVVENGKIVRTYLFIHRSQIITAGELINELGAPSSASYSSEGSVVLRWGEYSVVILIQRKFTPNSRVSFVAWGKMKDDSRFTEWRGFKTR